MIVPERIGNISPKKIAREVLFLIKNSNQLQSIRDSLHNERGEKGAAKKLVFGEVGIDMIAGPSEITVVADKSSNAKWVAADLIAQAEHDETSQSILVTNKKEIIQKIEKRISILLGANS